MEVFTLDETFKFELERVVNLIMQKKFGRMFQKEGTKCANSSGQNLTGFFEEWETDQCSWSIMLSK